MTETLRSPQPVLVVERPVYAIRRGVSGELLGAFTTSASAKSLADRREGEAQVWQESNSHGRMWKSLGAPTYVIEEVPLYSEKVESRWMTQQQRIQQVFRPGVELTNNQVRTLLPDIDWKAIEDGTRGLFQKGILTRRWGTLTDTESPAPYDRVATTGRCYYYQLKLEGHTND